MKWAIFDVDGTLFPKSSMEKIFVRESLKGGLLPTLNICHSLVTCGKYILQGRLHNAFKSNKAYLKTLPVDAVEKTAAESFKKHIVTGLSEEGKKRLDYFKRRGFKILIMTGAPIFLARYLCRTYSQNHLICTQLEINHNRFTGKIAGMHPYGKCKKELLLRLQQELDIDFKNSVSFANHHSDINFMELCGQAVAVNPDKRLRRFALKRGWKIEEWE